MEKKLDYSSMPQAMWKKSRRQHTYTATYYPSRDTAGEVRTNSLVTYSCGPLHMDEQRQDDQLEPIYNSLVLIQVIALKTYREQWMIETGGERGSGRSVLAAQHDDDDDDENVC